MCPNDAQLAGRDKVSAGFAEDGAGPVRAPSPRLSWSRHAEHCLYGDPPASKFPAKARR
jgi:hypothetical protein